MRVMKPDLRHLRKAVLISLPALVIVIFILEGVFRWLIPAAERPNPILDHDELIPKYETGAGTYTIGPTAAQRGRWRINASGWNNDGDYEPDTRAPTIAVIGDSFVEAFQVNVDQAFFSILDKLVGPGTRVYSFGRAGAPLSHYLHVSRYVARHYDPATLVITVIHNDFDQSITPLNPWSPLFMTLDLDGDEIREVPPKPRGPSQTKKRLKKSALVRYLFYNLRLSAVLAMVTQRNAAHGAPVDFDRRIYDNLGPIARVIDHTIGRIRAENKDRRIIFVMDAPRREIYAGRLEGAESLVLHRMMQDATRRYGCGFLDLTGPMAAEYSRHGRPFNSELDLHWNQFGHAFVARELHRFMTRPSSTPPVEPDP